ncbi:hypothetical protein J1N35_013544 [Gossypium stocksii]|uniref:Syntaxin N-terminal domain-containing protein n=1 Tax=Gossypium stocksii TaxID=47602 RepID=A0A9D3VTX7_9ROSI|nr:hypothetical protein J1N35_013544 [Gossypium stocksii]
MPPKQWLLAFSRSTPPFPPSSDSSIPSALLRTRLSSEKSWQLCSTPVFSAPSCLIPRHKTRLHIGQLVKDTSAKLKQASESDHRAEVSASKKVADAKLAKDFQAVLKEFQKAQRLAAERETAYTPFVPQAVPPSRDSGEIIYRVNHTI